MNSYQRNDKTISGRLKDELVMMDIQKGIQAPEDRVRINKKITEKYKKMAEEDRDYMDKN